MNLLCVLCVLGGWWYYFLISDLIRLMCCIKMHHVILSMANMYVIKQTGPRRQWIRFYIRFSFSVENYEMSICDAFIVQRTVDTVI